MKSIEKNLFSLDICVIRYVFFALNYFHGKKLNKQMITFINQIWRVKCIIVCVSIHVGCYLSLLIEGNLFNPSFPLKTVAWLAYACIRVHVFEAMHDMIMWIYIWTHHFQGCALAHSSHWKFKLKFDWNWFS